MTKFESRLINEFNDLNNEIALFKRGALKELHDTKVEEVIQMPDKKWPPLDEVENLRWTNNHTQYRSITYGFCEAQDCCEVCDSRMQMLCKTQRWIDGIRLRIIKRHYGIKNGW